MTRPDHDSHDGRQAGGERSCPWCRAWGPGDDLDDHYNCHTAYEAGLKAAAAWMKSESDRRDAEADAVSVAHPLAFASAPALTFQGRIDNERAANEYHRFRDCSNELRRAHDAVLALRPLPPPKDESEPSK